MNTLTITNTSMQAQMKYDLNKRVVNHYESMATQTDCPALKNYLTDVSKNIRRENDSLQQKIN